MRFLLFIALLFSFVCEAQPPCAGLGGTPETSIAVCGTLPFPQNVLNSCTGPLIPQSNNASCGAMTSSNSVWYKFHCYQAGTLGFLIQPGSATDDYDWTVINITGRPTSDILTVNLSISSNMSQRTSPGAGSTGCIPSGTQSFACGGTSQSQFNAMPNLVTGGDYLIMVTNFSNSGLGYTLTFGGGTAVITNPLPPTITSVSTIGCNTSQLKVTFSEDILCSSLSTVAEGSEFSITNGTNVITGITSNCTLGNNSITELTLTLQNPLPSGNYNLVVNNGGGTGVGNVNNTLLDICNDPMQLGLSFPFTINSQTPPAVNAITYTGCNPNVIKVALSKPITCASITNVFSVTPGVSPIASVQTACGGTITTTDTLLVFLQNPLAGGNYNLNINAGTLVDVCGLSIPSGTAVPFTIAATPPVPSASSPINYCQGNTATALTASGTNLLWYTVATGGTGSSTAPIPSTTTPGSITYYVSQSAGSCESPRTPIIVFVKPTPTAPTVTTPVDYCQNAVATALTATGTTLLWYTTATGGTGSSTALTPSTLTGGSISYYVSQTAIGCEGPRAAIVVNVTATPTAPIVTSPVSYCQNTTAIPLTATGTNLLWYTSATGGTGSITAPTPSTTGIGSTNYYVSQSTGTCEGPRALIVVNVSATLPAPTATTPIAYCQNAAATALTAVGSNLLWYTVATAGTGTATAPTPSTITTGSTTYYVSQTSGTCEGPRAAIVVNVNGAPLPPIVGGAINYCVGQPASQLSATGTNLLWYNLPTGGVGSTTAPTPNTATANTTSYYVSSTIGICEGPRSTIVVYVNAIPAVPSITTTSYSYCQGFVAPALSTAGVGTTNLLWYTTATGGVGSTTVPTPSTASVASTNYYVNEIAGICEGPRLAIVVNVATTPGAPTVTTPISYCQSAPTNPLTAIGTNLLWYTTATGGVGSSTAPLPSSATAGTTAYYVSQKIGSCEGPRAMIDVNIVATPAAPIVANKTYCPNEVATPLTAIGTNLLWYTTATGGFGTSTAPTANTIIFPTTYNFYVSQSTGACEGPRALLVVTIDNPLSVNIGLDTTICEGDTVKFNPIVTPPASSYSWRAIGVPQNTIINNSIIDATVRPVDTASYILKATLGGCFKEDTVNVNVRWKPTLDAGLTQAICLKDSALLVGVVSHASGPISTYRWTPTDSLRTDTLIQTWAYPTKTTYYKLTIATTLADYGCVFTSSDSVKLIVQPIVHAFAGNDTIAVKGAAHKLLGSGGVNYNWSSPTASLSNPFVQYPITTLTNDASFYLQVKDAIGCVGYDTVFVKVYNGPTYYVPNTFTPNGDGMNDIFRAIPVGLANTTYFRIFNRNGLLMFETNQYLKGWDGTYNGKPQPNGVYVWMVSGTDKDNKRVEMKGTVNLIR